MIVAFIATFMSVIIISILATRCPNCKKLFALKEYKRKEISCSHRCKNLKNGNGKRFYNLVTYEITYKCKNCGTTCIRTKKFEED